MDNYEKTIMSAADCLAIFHVPIVALMIGGAFYVVYLLLRYFGVI